MKLVVSIIASLWVLTMHAQSDEYFDSEGVRIHYQLAGAGQPIILLHGFTDNIEICFEDPIETLGAGYIGRLSENFQVISMDARGHGMSDKPTGSDNYGVVMVEDVIRLMDHLSIKKAHMIGYSMGGFTIGKMIQLYPERILSINMVGAGPALKEVQNPDHPLNVVCQQTAVDLEDKETINSLLRYFWPDPSEIPASDSLSLISKDILTDQNPQALKDCMLGLMDLFSMGGNETYNVPMQLVFGDRDPLLSFWKKSEEKDSYQLIVVPEADHMNILSYEQGLIAIEKFLFQLNR